MILPKRTPWRDRAELESVFAGIYESSGDLQREAYAIERIQVWVLRGNCAHFMESTGNLLSGLNHLKGNKLPKLELRVILGMNLIRFVNLLIDNHQSTYFAQSMTTIATQLGLPLYFIELRHAATHEDLPSLAILKTATIQALDWLYTNHWLPAISTQSIQLPDIQPIKNYLITYKALTKTSIRDTSKSFSLKSDLLKVYRGIEIWVQGIEKLISRDLAVQALIEPFLGIGGLVPTAKRKRCSTRAIELSTELIAIWTPLLSRMEDAYEGFHESLMQRIIEILSQSETETMDKPYILTLMAWIAHFLTLAEDPLVSENLIKTCLLSSSPNTLSLLDLLAKSDTNLAEMIKPLMSVLRNSDTGISVALDISSATQKLAEMEKRMMEMDALLFEQERSTPKAMSTARESSWKLVKDWKPCPFGLLPNA